MTSTPISMLTAAFEESVIDAVMDSDLDAKHNGRGVVISWPSVPLEIIRAAGFVPIVARGGQSVTPAADMYLEEGIFPGRLRMLAEAILTGRLSSASQIIVPRSSDADYKFFLYLREFARLRTIPESPPVLLFDLLQSRGSEVRSYNAARIQNLLHELEPSDSSTVTVDDVRIEIARTNAARAASRRLMSLRRGMPRVAGAEVFPLLCAFWSVDPQVYAALANAAADEIARRSPLPGPRVLLAGAPVDGTILHSAIEACGAVVVSEIGPWGGGAAGANVDGDTDPFTALADKYAVDAIGPRTPFETLRAEFISQLDDVDAVVVSLPPQDTTFGWDYPALRNLLRKKGIPHQCVFSDTSRPLSAADEDRLSDLIHTVPVRTEVRGG